MKTFKTLEEKKPEQVFMANFKNLIAQQQRGRKEMIEDLQVNPKRYDAWVEGRCYPPLFYKLKIAQLFQTPIEDLLTQNLAA